MTSVKDAQEFLARSDIDAWLIYDYRGMNPTLARVTGPLADMTRPCFYLVPREGEPTFLAHYVDAGRVEASGLKPRVFYSRDGMVGDLENLLSGVGKVAMEYSPRGELPRVSKVDAGTVELVRGFGCEVVSSGDLAQYVTMRWSPDQLHSHQRASVSVGKIVHQAFEFIGKGLASGVDEYQVREYIHQRFTEEGLATDAGPTVAINEHGSDPHYQPTASDSSAFKMGDWVLIDLWAREPGDSGIYADICWVAYLGARVPEEHQRVFDAVIQARDLAFEGLQRALEDGVAMEGWQVDRIARDHIEKAGYGEAFGHRLGHSLGAQVHDDGVNLDDLETHDTRMVIPGVGLTIEPGIYLDNFGVRSEINFYVEEKRLLMTSPLQQEVVLIGG
ncbi:MAG: aminopeptidase P family protein [Chloroflexi bacterium]|nr:aminopeptidase P family protein [Chloroflexota bacterium]